jgi:RNA polymerase sigma-70 factor (ECF subfamily)
MTSLLADNRQGKCRHPMTDIGYDLVAILPRLRRFARAICGSADIADDLVQATCARALAAADSWQPGTRLDAWLFRILRNLWIDRLRRSRVEGAQVDVDDRRDLVGDRGEPAMHARLTLDRVRKAIAALPDDQREVLVLVCVEEKSYIETADILGIPMGTVMSRLARARKRLMTLIEQNRMAACMIGKSGSSRKTVSLE